MEPPDPRHPPTSSRLRCNLFTFYRRILRISNLQAPCLYTPSKSGWLSPGPGSQAYQRPESVSARMACHVSMTPAACSARLVGSRSPRSNVTANLARVWPKNLERVGGAAAGISRSAAGELILLSSHFLPSTLLILYLCSWVIHSLRQRLQPSRSSPTPSTSACQQVNKDSPSISFHHPFIHHSPYPALAGSPLSFPPIASSCQFNPTSPSALQTRRDVLAASGCWGKPVGDGAGAVSVLFGSQRPCYGHVHDMTAMSRPPQRELTCAVSPTGTRACLASTGLTKLPVRAISCLRPTH